MTQAFALRYEQPSLGSTNLLDCKDWRCRATLLTWRPAKVPDSGLAPGAGAGGLVGAGGTCGFLAFGGSTKPPRGAGCRFPLAAPVPLLTLPPPLAVPTSDSAPRDMSETPDAVDRALPGWLSGGCRVCPWLAAACTLPLRGLRGGVMEATDDGGEGLSPA